MNIQIYQPAGKVDKWGGKKPVLQDHLEEKKKA